MGVPNGPGGRGRRWIHSSGNRENLDFLTLEGTLTIAAEGSSGSLSFDCPGSGVSRGNAGWANLEPILCSKVPLQYYKTVSPGGYSFTLDTASERCGG